MHTKFISFFLLFVLFLSLIAVEPAFAGPGGIYRISAPSPTAFGSGARFVSITPSDGPNPVGIVVTPNCPAGVAKYVGFPGDPDNVAVLVDSPASAAFLTKEEWGTTVHVTDINITPVTSYRVQVDLGSPGSPVLSGAAFATTAGWGDSAGGFANGAWAPPDGAYSISDVLAIIQAFSGVSTAPPLYRTDMRGVVNACEPNLQIDINDALASVAQFQGLSYQMTLPQCPVVCP